MNGPRNYWKLASVILALFLVCSVGYTFAQGFTTPDVYLDDLPASATYTIKTDGTYYWAVRYDGEVSWSSTNASYIINSAVDATAESGGGQVLLKPNSPTSTITTYLLDSSIRIRGGVQLIGEGDSSSSGVRLRLANNADCDMFLWDGTEATEFFFTIENLDLDGNYLNNAQGSGINIGGSGGHQCSDVHVRNTIIHWFSEYGIRANYSWGLLIENNVIETNEGEGIRVTGDTARILGNRLIGNYYGIDVVGGKAIVANNYLESNDRYGIILQGSGSGCVVTGNTFVGNSVEHAGWYFGLYLSNTQNATVTGNTFNGANIEGAGIQIVNVSPNNLIIGNNFYGTFNGNNSAIWDNSATTKIDGNVGFVTENSFLGANTTATTAVINHGLASNATYVWCSFNTSAITGYTWSSSATQVTITPTGTLPASWTCYVKAEYVP